MKKPFIFLLHFGYWLIYLLLLLVIFSIVNIQFKKTPSFPTNLFLSPVGISCVLPNLSAFYASYFLLFPRFLSRSKIIALIIFGTLVCLTAALLCSLVLLVFFGADQPVFNNATEFFGLVLWLSLVAGIHGVIALVIRGFISWYDELKLKEELAQKNYEMELALIKSQINPHFLFNTINNIDVLITRDAAKASGYLNKLSDIMRYMVYETKTDRIPLSKELAYIEKYLELEKIRTSNPHYVNFEVNGTVANQAVAPMILFPFIENAFKHTENRKSSNSINIRVLVEKGRLVFECENTYRNNPALKQDYGGLGNELIRKRLMLLYPDRHVLEISDNDGIYQVKLLLDLYEN